MDFEKYFARQSDKMLKMTSSVAPPPEDTLTVEKLRAAAASLPKPRSHYILASSHLATNDAYKIDWPKASIPGTQPPPWDTIAGLWAIIELSRLARKNGLRLTRVWRQKSSALYRLEARPLPLFASGGD